MGRPERSSPRRGRGIVARRILNGKRRGMSSPHTILVQPKTAPTLPGRDRLEIPVRLEPSAKPRVDAGRGATETRDLRFDFLRVAGAFAIVWLHVAAEVISRNPDARSADWWIGNIADAFSRWGVPIFIMVSGALLLSRPIDEDLGRYYRRRAARLLTPLIFWTAFYLFVHYCRTGTLGVHTAAKLVLAGRPAPHLWFLYMIVGLYLVAPFLRRIVAGGARDLQLAFILLCFALGSIDSLIGSWKNSSPATFLATFPPYIAYFAAGHYLATHPRRLRVGGLLAVLIACGALIALGTGALLPALGQRSWSLMYSYLNPLVAILSLCVFQWTLQTIDASAWPRRRASAELVRRLAPITLGIYLIHPFWLELLNGWGLNGFCLHPLFGIAATTVVAFGLSTISAALLAIIPILKYTVK
jgi:surface polysaccharide O-acyltransferase-like enzyme